MCLQSDTLSFNLLSCIERQRERERERGRDGESKRKTRGKEKEGRTKKELMRRKKRCEYKE